MKRFALMFMLLLLLALSGCNITISTPTTSTSGTGTGGTPNWGVQTKTSGCVAHGGLADAACTPGAILATGTKDAICTSGYSRSVRNVPNSEKDQVYAEYGITHHSVGEFE